MKKLLLLLLLPVLAVVAFYLWHEKHSDLLADQQGLSGEAANGLKHSNAGAEVYQLLRLTGLSSTAAEKHVVFLGVANERLEQWVKVNKPDSTLEMMKDLHNNFVGIVAAQWLENHAGAREDALIKLAHGHVLLLGRDEVALDSYAKELAYESRDLNAAQLWFVGQKEHIRVKVNVALAADNDRPTTE